MEHARLMGEQMRARLEAMRATYPMIGDVRGAGLLQGVELVADRDTRQAYGPDVKPGKLVEAAARRRGLIFRCATDYVAFSPPLCVHPGRHRRDVRHPRLVAGRGPGDAARAVGSPARSTREPHPAISARTPVHQCGGASNRDAPPPAMLTRGGCMAEGRRGQ